MHIYIYYLDQCGWLAESVSLCQVGIVLLLSVYMYHNRTGKTDRKVGRARPVAQEALIVNLYYELYWEIIYMYIYIYFSHGGGGYLSVCK